jgi:ribosomal protein S18 acetylase RimI-like enzyme
MNWKERIVHGSSPRYRNHSGVAFGATRRLAAQSLPDQDYALAGNTRSVVVSKLSFDSDLLGISCGRIAAIGALTELDAIAISQQAIDLASALKIEHLSVRSNSDDLILLDALQACGFEPVDAILTFTRSLHNFSPIASDPQIRPATLKDIEPVGEIARHAFSIDRFHVDPFITKECADELHFQWAKNSVLGTAGTAANAVVVATDEDDRPIGFATCKLNLGTFKTLGKFVGTIVLVATSEAARGQGFGRRMTGQALNWLLQNGVDIVEVGSQAVNKPAARLYESAGFQLTDHSVSVRKWLGTGSSVVEAEAKSAKILM